MTTRARQRAMTDASPPQKGLWAYCKSLARPWSPSLLDDNEVFGPNTSSGTYYARDRVELFYEERPGGGPVMVFLYGLGCTIHHWKHQIEHLCRHPDFADHRLIWMDYRGHGLSEPAHAGMDLTFERMVQDVQEVCSHLGVQRATFLGQSLGGTYALMLAQNAPELVDALVVQGPPLRAASQTMSGGLPIQLAHRWVMAVNRYTPAIVRAGFRLFNGPFHRPFYETIRFTGFNPELVTLADIDAFIERLLMSDPNVFFRLADHLESFDFLQRRVPIRCPVFILAGQQDAIVPASDMYALAETISRSELHILAHGSHCPHIDDPHGTSALITEFLQRVHA